MKKVSNASGVANKVLMFFKKNIYFVLMIVCVLAIGTMITIAAVNGSNDEPNAPIVSGDPDDDNDDTDNTDNDNQDNDDDDDNDQTNTTTFVLSGILDEYTVDIGFSDSELVFNPTQNHWATHEGLDLKADAGAEVYCPVDGTVKSVSEDTFYGTTVVISHEGGYETTYKLLKEVELVEGESIKKGEVIGKINENALAEIAQGAHLHLEVTKDGVKVDPMQFMQEGDK